VWRVERRVKGGGWRVEGGPLDEAHKPALPVEQAVLVQEHLPEGVYRQF